jgi:hypothetical protein
LPPDKLHNQKSAFINTLLEDGRVYAAVSIADGIREYLGEETKWNQFQIEEATTLKNRIEGELTKEKLKEKIDFINRGASTEDFEKIQEYLMDWIDAADNNSLQKFVKAISANDTLSLARFSVEINGSKVAEFIPETHTCFFKLKLSSKYPNQETFNAKLKLLLTEGLDQGDGFQIA